MAAALDPLHVPLRTSHTCGIDFLAHVHVSACFDNVLVVVDHSTQMVGLFPCTEEITAKVFLQGVYRVPCFG
jgi:hypothetical protein